MTTSKDKRNDILVVDDTPANLKFLSLMLSRRNYEVRTATDGPMALEAVREAPPDLILLDIMMPRMDGYEVCRRLKSDAVTRDIPVIFISALDDANDKVKAFKSGGVDYITKPFELQEVLARVANHLTLRQLQRKLQEANNELERRVEERTAELVNTNVSLKEEIAERHRIEKSLRENEEKYRNVFEDSKDTIFIFRPTGQIEDINSAGLTMFGYSRAEILTLPTNELFVTPPDLQRFHQEIEQKGGVKDFEVKLKKKDGSQMDCLITATLHKSDTGLVLGYQGIIRDITERKQAERERLLLLSIQRELGIAQEIQESLLPPPEPEWDDLEVICLTTPAREMGGDLYAYHAFERNETSVGQPEAACKYAVAVGDVSGKGMPAALLMAVSLASFRSIVVGKLSPSDFLGRMDNALADYTHRSRQNCALVYLEITPPQTELSTGTVRLANAGCVTPLLKRVDGEVAWIEIGGMPLGVGLGAKTGYQEISLPLTKGDFIILTSDGIIEANNEAGEMFGFDRLEQAAAQGPQSSAEDMLEHLLEEVTEFVGFTEPHDDMTIMVVKV